MFVASSVTGLTAPASAVGVSSNVRRHKNSLGGAIDILGILALLAFVLWLTVFNVRLYFRTRHNPDALRERLNDQFKRLVVPSSDPRLHFEGRTAEVVKDDEEFEMVNLAIVSIKVRRIARNPAGEYFLFVSDGDARPYLKHVPHSNAKVLLGTAYAAPPGDA